MMLKMKAKIVIVNMRSRKTNAEGNKTATANNLIRTINACIATTAATTNKDGSNKDKKNKRKGIYSRRERSREIVFTKEKKRGRMRRIVGEARRKDKRDITINKTIKQQRRGVNTDDIY